MPPTDNDQPPSPPKDKTEGLASEEWFASPAAMRALMQFAYRSPVVVENVRDKPPLRLGGRGAPPVLPLENKDKDNHPTNEEIVDYLQRGLVMHMHKCPVLERTIGKRLTTFEYRTKFEGTEYHFEGMWLDGTGKKVLAGMTNKEYARAKALASLLDDKCFASVVHWAVAIRNALGDNIDEISVAGSIFVDGQCVDELLDAEEDKRFAGVFVEPVASPAEDKTDGKQPASPTDKTDFQVDPRYKEMFLYFFCEGSLETVS